MKKTLIALAVLATAGTAFAQSTVSLTGIVGAAAQSYDTIGGSRQRGISLTDATIKVGVTEDLGSGLKAAAGIEFDESSERFGNALNRRKTFVSLTGGFGQVSFTNVRSGNLLTQGMVAPANLYLGIYDGSMVVNRSPVDALTYGTKFGDFTASVQYVESATDGAQNGAVKVGVLNGGYAKGPLAVGIAVKGYSFREDLPMGLERARKNRLEAFATYDLGVAKFGVGYDGKNVGTSDAVYAANLANEYASIRTPGTADYVRFNRAAAWSVGVSAPLGAFTVGANYAKRDIAKLTEVVAKYDLSKRTNLNASFGRQTANEGTDSGNQYRIGMYHSF
ncbi:MAG: porin [Rhodoferax sp.]|uniref:porin n=1 Tax=Rhodoferax sp. TaxID=50421 RepID=UPI0014008891|nr:porin [Rhodoferax sp.]NDP40338.1 porin [Rhodoferax sp.]